MKILTLDTKTGYVKIKADNLDDLWILSRLIDTGDLVSGETSRIIKKEEGQEGIRKRVFVKLRVEKVDFAKQTNTLRLLGTITESSNPDIPLRSHHTLAVEPGDVISVSKELKKWHIERLKEAEESAKRPKLLLCAADYGEATIAVLREFGIEFLTDISKTLPGKEDVKYEENKEEFIRELAKVLEQTAKNQNISKIVVGGIGFFAENMKKLLNKFPYLQKNALIVKISHSDKTGINELIKRGVVDQVVKHNRISDETKIIEEFFQRIATKGLATYGFEHVKKAAEYGAVEQLLISDNTIKEYKEKDKFPELDSLMSAAEKASGKITIISTEHDAGERFDKIGLAALLRFAVE
jgi:protein pelota